MPIIHAVDRALHALQAALHAHRLYPPGHETIREAVREAHARLVKTLVEREQIAVFVVEDRIVFDETPLPSSRALSCDLFHALQQGGASRLVFHRGLPTDELASLIESLSGGGSLYESPHIRLFHQDAGRHAAAQAVDRQPERMPREHARALPQAWRQVVAGDPTALEELGRMVSDFALLTSKHRSVLLPLALIKQDDEYTYVHTVNVAMLSAALGEAVGITGAMAGDVLTAALLHDIGKRQIPDAVLNKPSRLSDHEFQLMRQHPEKGARILLGNADVPALTAVVAYEHHIHVDGTGYPDVPDGYRTSLVSQIVQVADVYDALRTRRSYKEPMSIEKSTQIMREQSGSKFDSDLLDIFFDQVVSRDERAAVA